MNDIYLCAVDLLDQSNNTSGDDDAGDDWEDINQTYGLTCID